jgi:hypothetical protein
MALSYLVRRVPTCPAVGVAADWEHAEQLEINQFHPKSSNHLPRTRVRLLHDGRNIAGQFLVEDRYVISKATEYQQSVCVDSCVEFFFQPKETGGYFNLEINCGGTFLLHYIGTEMGSVKHTPVSAEHARLLSIYHSMPATVLTERTEPTDWRIDFRFPLAMLEPYIGQLTDFGGQSWMGNFYKCADHSSHPHWGSWAPIGEKLNFHQPGHFQRIQFE